MSALLIIILETMVFSSDLLFDNNVSVFNVVSVIVFLPFAGGALSCTATTGSITLISTFFDRNTAVSNGGALSFDQCAVTMSDSTVVGNTAGNIGGGLMLARVTVGSFTGTTITNNYAAVSGGGVYLQNSAVCETGVELLLNVNIHMPLSIITNSPIFIPRFWIPAGHDFDLFFDLQFGCTSRGGSLS